MKRIINKTIALALLLMATFASCKKNDIDDTGQFRLKVVNAAPASTPQTFTLAGNLLISYGLTYMDASDYVTSASGKRLVAEFKNLSNGSVYGSGEIYTANTITQTVYLIGQGSKVRVKVFTDDLSTPNSGKVKVKFIHFSDNAPSNVKIKNGSGDEIVNNITRNEDSGYKFIDAGTLTIQLSGLALGENLGTYNISDLQSGKIYTIYFTDAIDGKLVINKVLHN